MSGIPSWARVGQKVVCVDDDWDTSFCRCPLEKGEIYTIVRAFEIGAITAGKFAGTRGSVIELVGVVNPDSWADDGFSILRFRPLIARSQAQDVAEFRKLLDHIPAGVDA